MLIGGVLVALCVIPVMLLVVDPLMGLYGQMSPEAIQNLRSMLITLSVFFWIKMCAYNLICGIARAGGDAAVPGIIDVLGTCAVALPVIFVLGYVLKWPLIYVFPFSFLADVFTTSLCYIRYRKGYWKQKLS